MVRDVRLWGRIVAVTHDDRVKCDCGELVPASIVGDVESPHRVARPISECRPHVDLCDEAQWTDRPRVRWASERIW